MTTSNARSRVRAEPATSRVINAGAVARSSKQNVKTQPRIANRAIARPVEDCNQNIASTPLQATEKFNTALKVLSEALKRKSEDGVKDAHNATDRNGAKGQSPTRSPLQTRSPNRPSKQVSSSAEQKHGKTFSAAELTRAGEIAIACLQRLYFFKEEEGKDDKTQLDQGSLTLATKLLGIGLIDLAIKELCHFGQRLNQQQRESSDEPQRKAVMSSDVRIKLLSYLQVDDPDGLCSKQAIQLILYHTLILKAIARQETSLPKGLLDLLSTSNERGPSQFIARCFKSKLLTVDEGLQRLHNLCQLISALGKDCLQVEKKDRKQIMKYRLGCLSLETRCMHWQIGKSKVDLAHDLWKPFMRHLNSVDAGTMQPASDDASFILQGFEALRGWAKKLSAEEDSTVPASVLQAVGDRASKLGDTGHALSLFQEAEALTRGDQGLSGAALACKSAVLSLSRMEALTGDGVFTAVQAAITSLQRPLKGGVHELGTLLTDVVQLRRSAAQTIVGLSKRPQPGTDGRSKSLEYICSSAIIACVRFFFRYLRAIGEPSNDFIDSSLSQMLKSMQSAIDSSLAVLKTRAVCDSAEEWNDSEQALSDAHQLSSYIIEHFRERESFSFQMTFTRVSNIICCRAQVVPTKEKIELLRKAINIVQKRPSQEWQAGALFAKYEKLAGLLYGQGNVADAINAYRLAAHACLDPDTMADVSRLTAQGASDMAWKASTERVRCLDRTITSHLRMFIKGSQQISESCNELVDETLPSDIRASLLECYLEHLLRLQSSKPSANLLVKLSRAILSFYQPMHYPLRRLRVLFSILSRAYEYSRTSFLPVLDDLANDETHFGVSEGNLSLDGPLGPYRRALISCFQLVSAFHLGRPSKELLEHTVDSWDTLLCSMDPHGCLRDHIEHGDLFFGLISTIVDYSDALDMNDIRLQSLLVLRKALILDRSLDSHDYLSTTLKLVTNHVRSAKMREAERCLIEANNLLEKGSHDDLTYVRWHLTTAELRLERGNLVGTSEALEGAQKRAAMLSASGVPHSKAELERLLTTATLLQSRLSQRSGQLEEAEVFAKQSTRLSIRAWSLLEKSEAQQHANQSVNGDQLTCDSTLDTLAENFAVLAMTTADRRVSASYGGSVFWSHFSDHVRTLLNVSSIAAFNGSYQDAIYYAEQAEKVAVAIGSSNWLVQIRSLLADHYVSGSCIEKAMELLGSCQIPGWTTKPSLTTVYLEQTLARAHSLTGDLEAALKHLEAASGSLAMLSKGAAASVDPSTLPCIHEQVPGRKNGKNAMQESKTIRTGTRRQGSKAETNKPSRPTVRSKGFSDIPPGSAPSSLERLASRLLLQRIKLYLTGHRLEEALELLGDGTSSNLDLDGQLVQALLMYQTAKIRLQDDSVYGILVDSTISWPSRETSGKAFRGEVSKAIVKAKRGKKNLGASPVETLEQVLTTLVCEKTPSDSGASIACLRLSKELYVQASILLSAIKRDIVLPSSKLMHTTHCANVVASEREAFAIKTDIRIQGTRYLSEWPSHAHGSEVIDTNNSIHLPLCQGDVSTLPSSWKVISISISNDKRDLLLGSMQRDREPFTLRLPIQRQMDDDDDEADPFDYTTCRTEFLEIIEQANVSAHATGSRNDKQVKKDWWARRESLNAQLAILLENIENIWLGGYRGIFCAEMPDQACFAKFAQSLERILDTHLPSRQKSVAGTRTKVHQNVLDLFIGLGDPDLIDLDEPVADLLAFVVDILQFSGEANAYDEIDFDMMAVETIDAIRAYHKRATSQSTPNHIIFILDKDLLCLPWESLPCLRGKSVSRVPSLHSLQLQLDQMRSSVPEPLESIAGLTIPSTSGSYVLNPSQDLTSTHSLFSPLLSTCCPSFTPITSRAPTEEEFLSCLTTSSLCLYFGHGSGAQYIRGRTIRKIHYQDQIQLEQSQSPREQKAKRAAVTFLMGCSSALMHEAGTGPDFSPYGVPWNYMHAGSPAVVGTLWDVTDKDIDRFTLHSLVNWGLLEPESLSALEETKKGKGKGRGKKVEEERIGRDRGERRGGKYVRGKVNLCEAVAKAKEDACVLRYLNAAAVVVYGVPVYLD